jgi:hypothetical protein
MKRHREDFKKCVPGPLREERFWISDWTSMMSGSSSSQLGPQRDAPEHFVAPCMGAIKDLRFCNVREPKVVHQ